MLDSPAHLSGCVKAAASLAALTSVWLLILLGYSFAGQILACHVHLLLRIAALHAYLALTGLTTLEWAKGLPPGATTQAEPRRRVSFWSGF